MTTTLHDSLTIDQPTSHSLLDDGAQGVIGTDHVRVEGSLKVSGTATYTAEFDVPGITYGFMVLAAVPRATVLRLDDAAARRVPGVLDVFTDPGFVRHSQIPGQMETPEHPNTEVAYAGQPIALVVAETYEAAREAGQLVRPVYDQHVADVTFSGREREAQRPGFDQLFPPYTDQGDLDHGLREADVTLDVTYTTPGHNSAAMEPHATIAQWDGDDLTVHSAVQLVDTQRTQLADALGIPEERIRLLAPYVGGGFGSKLFLGPETVASALAARALGRPVKTVMTRPHVFMTTSRRTNTSQRIRLGATHDGRLVAIGHDSIGTNLPGQDFFEPSGIATRFLYAAKNRRVHHDIVRTDWTISGMVRAPGEASGMLALEVAMDEMAEKLGLDPIAFRTMNEPERHPEKDVPFSSRALIRCLALGAERFGWSDRKAPGQVRDGDWLVGMGVASAARTNQLQPNSARVTLSPEGSVMVESSMTDIGTGTYTVLAQIAGEMLGLPADQVTVRLGDSALPASYGSGGSVGASSSGSAVYVACEAIRKELASRVGCEPNDLRLKDGHVIRGDQTVPLDEFTGDGITAEGDVKPGESEQTTAQASYGAHFAEVGVNRDTGEIRVRRMLGVFAAGRILNLRTARSQCLGGMVFGIGGALEEALIHDPRTGKIVNHDLAEYHVPVNADVPALDVVFLEERDHAANPLQSKGLGELSVSGAGAAINNAVYNATGIRVRDYPVTLDKLLLDLPSD